MIKALEGANYTKTEVKNLMSGKKTIGEVELNQLSDILVQNKIKGLRKYSSGGSFVRSFKKELQKKENRLQFLRKQRRDEDAGVNTKKRESIVSIGGMKNEDRQVSALEAKETITSALERPNTSTNTKPTGSKPPRIKLPF